MVLNVLFLALVETEQYKKLPDPHNSAHIPLPDSTGAFSSASPRRLQTQTGI